MHRLNSFRFLLTTVLFAAAFAGCSGARKAANDAPAVVTVSDIDASGDEPVFFSFADGKPVGSGDAWDISFKGTDIGVNGTARVVDRAFERVLEAPESGYLEAVPKTEEERWFEYNPDTHVVTPVPFRTIIVRTSSGGHAKIEIQDYYDGLGTPRFYTFRYAYQPSGSRFLAAIDG